MNGVNRTDSMSFGSLNFSHAELGDVRRTKRLVATVDQFCRHPGGSLPDKLSSPKDLKALYRLCEREEVTHAAIMTSTRQHTLGQIGRHDGVVLVLHDATELDYTMHNSLSDHLGQIGDGGGRGYICHNSLAIDADTREVFGLTNQILHHRVETPKKETLAQRRTRESRESRLWLRGTDTLPGDAKLVDVCDQGADTFEFLEHECHSGRQFVIRSKHSRKMYAGTEPTGKRRDLRNYVRSLTSAGEKEVTLQAIPVQKGKKARKARRAKLLVSFAAVCVDRPHAKHGEHGNDPLPMYVIRVWEPRPPKGEKALEWFLLTNHPVATLKDAHRVIEWYEARWVIEEYHKAMKTGCGIEELQFTYLDRLEPMIAVLSTVAITLLNLRAICRTPDAETRRATTLFSADYVRVLAAWRFKKPRTDLTIREFCLALARLGGHQNRKHDGLPGWITLWRGWSKLQAMLDGAEIAQHSHKKCG